MPFEAFKAWWRLTFQCNSLYWKKPYKQGKSTLVSTCKHKEDVQECSKYCPIKLTSRTMKWLERMIEGSFHEQLEHQVTNNEFGFMPGRSSVDTVFAPEYCRRSTGRNKELHWVLLELEQDYDRVPRELLCWCLQSCNLLETHFRLPWTHNRIAQHQ